VKLLEVCDILNLDFILAIECPACFGVSVIAC
jgi:hypothetical protein